MEEILALQRQLAAVQLEGATTRLSERNCVELVSKLMSLGLIDVVFTQSGKEYVTRDRLRREFERELRAHGGRINVVEAATLIGIDLHHVEKEVQGYLEEHKTTAQMIQGDVITEDYLDTTAEETSELLAENGDGIIALAELATTYGLPIDVIRSTVESRLGTKLRGRLEEGNLYTEAHLQRSKARVRGMMSGASTPISLGEVASVLQVRVHIVNDAVESLVSTGELRGVLQGRGERAVYLPAVFEATRLDAVRSYFRSNEHITMEQLRQFSVADPRKFAATAFPNDVLLGSAILSRAVCDQLEDAAQAAVDASSWLDAAPLLPAALSEEDVAEVLRRISPADGAILAEQRYVFSHLLVGRCRDVFAQDAKTKAEDMLRKAPSVTAPAAPAEPVAAAPGKAKKGKRKKGRAEAAASEEASATVGATAVRLEVPSQADAVAILEGGGELAHELEEDHMGQPADDLQPPAAAVVDLLHGELDAIYGDALRRATERVQRERAERSRRFERELGASLPRVELFLRGLEAVQNDELRELLDAHLLATQCGEIRDTSLRFFAGSGDDSGAVPAVASFPPQAQRHVRALQSAKSSADFLAAYDEHCKELTLPERMPLDKRRERALGASVRQQLGETLDAESDAVQVLALGAVLLFSRCKGGAVLHLPVKAVPLLVAELRGYAKGEMAEAVQSLHDTVLGRMEAAQEGTPEEDVAGSLAQAVQRVKQSSVAP